MILLSLFRFVGALLSLAVLGASAYLLWTWWHDPLLMRDATGDLFLDRQDWRLWTGLALLAWSFLGRPLILLLVGKSDGQGKAPAGEPHDWTAPSGSTLHVETFGPAGGQPIVFTHGWSMEESFWDRAKIELGDRYRLILWDLPGLGKSKTPGGDVSLERYARDLAAVIDRHAASGAVLVGHSIGGMIIQTLLRDQPQMARRLAGVALLNTTYTNPLKTMVASGLLQALQKPVIEPAMKLTIALAPLVWLSNWQSYLSGWAHLGNRLGFGRTAPRSELERVTLLATRNSPAIEARGNLAMLNWDATGALAASGATALVVAGGRDIVTKPEASHRIAEGGEAARLRVVPDANHYGPVEAHRLYDEMIADFALRVRASAAADLQTQTQTQTEAQGELRPRPAGSSLDGAAPL